MNFGVFPIDSAEGALLAHSTWVGKKKYPKGYQVTADDIAPFHAAGISEIVGAKLDDDDVPEDTAAAEIGGKMRHESVALATVANGRANLYANVGGLFVANVDAVNHANAIGEAITIATLATHEIVHERQVVATIKIIPFAAKKAHLTAVLQALAGPPAALTVHRFKPLTVGVVYSTVPQTKANALDKAQRVLTHRIDALGGRIAKHEQCGHDQDAVASAITTCMEDRCELVLVLGASAIVDRNDVVPTAIVRCGGELIHFGMPVEPGNLLLMARIADVPVVGLPGCARSPKQNGFDWVLHRLFADLPIGTTELSRMGVGGLLKEHRVRD